MNKYLLILGVLFSLNSLGQKTEIAFDRNPIEKKMVLLSTTFSLSHKQSEKEQTLVRFLDDSYRVVWDVTLRAGYFIKDGFCVGGYFTFGQDKNQLGYVENDFLVSDDNISNFIGIAPFIRNYYPLGDGKFMLFNQTSLEYRYSSGIRQLTNIDDLYRYKSQGHRITLGLQPGIAAFLSQNVSFEVSTSILGVSSDYQSSELTNDPDSKSYVWVNDLSFKIDLLSLNLGITFHFPS